MILDTKLLLFIIVAALFTAWQLAPERITKAIFAFLFMLLFLVAIRT